MKFNQIVLVLILLLFLPGYAFAQNLANIMMAEGAVVGKAMICMPTLANAKDAIEIGTKYRQWHLKNNKGVDMNKGGSFFGIGLQLGIGEQQKKGQAGCDEIIRQFKELSKAIGFVPAP